MKDYKRTSRRMGIRGYTCLFLFFSLLSCSEENSKNGEVTFERITVDVSPPVMYELTTHLYLTSCDTNYQINHSNNKVYINKELIGYFTDSSIIRNFYNDSFCKYKKQWEIYFYPKSSEKIETKEEYKKLLIKFAKEDIHLKVNNSLTLKGELQNKKFENTFGKKAW